MGNKRSIFSLNTGERCLVEELANNENGYYRQRLLSQGVIPGVILTVKRMSPFGDPIELLLPCGSSFIVRKQEAANIIRIRHLIE